MKTLTDPTDDQLKEAFAIHVAKWTFETFPNGACPHIKHWKNERGDPISIHLEGRWLTSADAVLPWLEKHREEGRRVTIEMGFKRWRIWIHDRQPSGLYLTTERAPDGDSDSLPRAAVIALLRSAGVDVVFNK